MVQGELFREDTHFEPQVGSPRSFLSKYQITLKLDKALLLLIVMMFAFGLSHSFGVERGKRIMERKIEALIPTQTQTFSAPDPMEDPQEVVESETLLVAKTGKQDLKLPTPPIEGPTGISLRRKTIVPPSEASETPTPPTPTELKKMGHFTVQLVTYDNKTLAEKEITRLKSKGYEGFIIPSGRFFQVCANYFDNKSKARTDLEALKQTGRYPDAYVRPVLR